MAVREQQDVALDVRGETASDDPIHPSTGGSRYARIFAQIQCEMACMIGDRDRARRFLSLADRQSLIDWHWIEHCPTLAPLRGDPVFASVRQQVRTRADAVAEALWDGDP